MIKLKDKWYEAIIKRYSVREYSDKVISPEVIKHLVDITAELNGTVKGVRIVFVNKKVKGYLTVLLEAMGRLVILQLMQFL
jgi:hypothetical protein